MFAPDQLVAVVAGPEHAARRIDDIGQRLDGTHRQAQLIAGGQRAHQRQPFIAVVVLVLEEVLGDEHPHPCPHRAGRSQHQQAEHGSGEKHDAQRCAVVAVGGADVIPDCRHQQQVNAGGQHRHRTQHQPPGNEQLQRPLRIARHRHRQQRHGHELQETTCGFDVGVEAAEQQGVGVEVEIEGENAAEAEAEQLDRPAQFRPGPPVKLFSQHQRDQRQRQHAGFVGRQAGGQQRGAQVRRQVVGQQQGGHAVGDARQPEKKRQPLGVGVQQRLPQLGQQPDPADETQHFQQAVADRAGDIGRVGVEINRRQRPEQIQADRNHQRQAGHAAAPAGQQQQQEQAQRQRGAAVTPLGETGQLDEFAHGLTPAAASSASAWRTGIA